ncbi:MAG: hypothetical protein ABSE17_03480 [Candidatus Levyibacteriota bacterium]|jgi:hypothetical protein
MAEAGEAKDLGDRLRTEASEASPKLDRAIARIAPVFCGIIEADFGQYMPAKARESGRGASKNIILTKQDDELGIRLAADYCEENGIDPDYFFIPPDLGREDVRGKSFNESKIGFPLITIDPKFWEDMPANLSRDYASLSAKEKERVSKYPGVKDYDIVPSDFWNCIRYIPAVAHELGHKYHARNLPLAWEELAADFIAVDVIDRLLGMSNSHDIEIDFVNELVGKYGKEAVMRLFFGTLRNPITRFRISGELSDKQRDAMFPEKSRQQMFRRGL